MGGQFFFGEKFALVGGGRTAPLLARDLLVLKLPVELMLEFVECECRVKPPKPSPLARSVESTATLFRRSVSRLSLSAISSVGVCPFSAPVPDELSEPVRFIVTTDADETDWLREDER